MRDLSARSHGFVKFLLSVDCRLEVAFVFRLSPLLMATIKIFNFPEIRTAVTVHGSTALGD